ncbi:MAG: 50S ribosomal protein L18e [Candidatus Aenigmatarchaeota archaeon]
MKKTNPVLKETIQEIEEKGRKENVDIWKDVAERLKKSRRKKNSVNISKINRHAEGGDVILVPGKVTGYGNLDKEVTVAALSFSNGAKKKVEERGEAIKISELIEEHPEGQGVKIMEG